MNIAPGWFGKLPMLGDFAHRRLPPSVVAACDTWASQGMATSRTGLGLAWLETYLSAPLWGFACGPRVFDSHWWCGALMPSVDAAGRYFPLLVLCAWERAPEASTAQARWYDALVGCLLGVLAPQASLAAFEASLARVADAFAARDDTEAQDTLPPPPAVTVDPLRGEHGSLQGCSVWWQLAPPAPPAMPACRWPGLPPANAFASLLQGTT